MDGRTPQISTDGSARPPSPGNCGGDGILSTNAKHQLSGF